MDTSQYRLHKEKIMENEDFKSFLERVLRQYEKDIGLVIARLQEGEGFGKGDGFSSEASVVKIEGVRGSGEPYSNNVFIKRPLTNTAGADTFDMESAFKNEAIVYCEVLPLLSEGKANISKCYYGGLDCIILENIRDQGFVMADKKMELDLAHCELVVMALGNFHASTYHLALVKEETFSKISSKLIDVFFNRAQLVHVIESYFIGALYNLNHLQDESLAPAIKKLEKYKKEMVNTMQKLHKSDLNVLGHGDFWLKNMMFRYQEGVVQDMRIVDFQTATLMSPAPDLWKFLYTCLSPDILKKHCDHLVSTYCTSFRDTLRRLKLPKDQIPEDALLKEEIYSRELYGFLMATLYLTDAYTDYSDPSVDTELKLSELETDLIVDYGKRLARLLKICDSKNLL